MVSFDIKPPRQRRRLAAPAPPKPRQATKSVQMQAAQPKQASFDYQVVVKIIVAVIIMVGVGIVSIRLMLDKSDLQNTQDNNLFISNGEIGEDIFDYYKWQDDFKLWQDSLQRNNILISTIVEFDNEEQNLDNIFTASNENESDKK